MARQKVEDIIEKLMLPIVEKHKFELEDVEFVKEGANWYLRIYIDKPGGVTIDDCQVVSEELSDRLDETDPIEQAYFLEVSSPGLEKTLKKDRDFIKYSGQPIELSLFQAVDGTKRFEGELLGLKENKISVKLDNGLVKEFEREKVSSVKRAVKF